MAAPITLVPFVPGGADFAKSRELFRALGFEEEWSISSTWPASAGMLARREAPTNAGGMSDVDPTHARQE